MSEVDQNKRSEMEARQRDLGNLLALVEYAKAEALRLGAETAPALLAAAMGDLEEVLIDSLEPSTQERVGCVIRLADRAELQRKKRQKLIG